jgi:uncharacterized protein (DUF2141 family)
MKYLLIALMLAQEVLAIRGNQLNLTITGIDPARAGEIVVMVFQKDGFPKDHTKALQKYSFEPLENQHQMKIQVPDGEFALKIHHDEDKSGTMTKNWTGIIPAEGIGFSSGAKIRFGPPSFKAAAMELPLHGSTSIQIIYP